MRQIEPSPLHLLLFIPNLKIYNIDIIKIDGKDYFIYNDENFIKFIMYEEELFGKKYNVHVEILKEKLDGTVVNQFESIKDKDKLSEFLGYISLDTLIQ